MPCRSVKGAVAVESSTFGLDNNTVVMRDFHCTGKEKNLNSCNQSPISGCNSESHAGVICGGEYLIRKYCYFSYRITHCTLSLYVIIHFIEVRYTNFSGGILSGVQIVDGPSPTQGVVEVFGAVNGYLCNDGWDNNAARVVCRMLGNV